MDQIPPPKCELFKKYIKEARKKLRENWNQAEWALFEIQGTYFFTVNGVLRSDDALHRAHERTHLDRSSIPTDLLARVSDQVDMKRTRYVAIKQIKALGIKPIAEGKIELEEGYPSFLRDGDLSGIS